jgi:hypothetical protein
MNISNLLPGCKFAHVPRDANQAAHGLAQRGLEKKECAVMRYDVPVDIRGLVDTKTARAVNLQILVT